MHWNLPRCHYNSHVSTLLDFLHNFALGNCLTVTLDFPQPKSRVKNVSSATSSRYLAPMITLVRGMEIESVVERIAFVVCCGGVDGDTGDALNFSAVVKERMCGVSVQLATRSRCSRYFMDSELRQER